MTTLRFCALFSARNALDGEKARLTNLRATEASLRDVPRKLSENEAAVEKASELQKRIAQMQAAYKTYRETVRDLGQRQAVAKADLKRWQDAQDALKTVRTAFYAHQAGFLAETLRDEVVRRVDAWAAAPGDRPLDGIRDDYLARLAWLGDEVRVLAGDGGTALACGTFETVDPWGRAVVGGTAYAAELSSLRPLA